MSKLPNLGNQKPVYTTTLPTTQQKIKYSPYDKHQQKSILIASQEDDYSNIIATLENIIKQCCETEIKTIADFTHVLTHIKAKSHGESDTFIIPECKCTHKNIEVKIDNILDCMKVKNQDKLKDTYNITDKISLRLCPTKIGMLKSIKFEESIENYTNLLDSMIANSIDYVVNDKEIIKDFTEEDLIENIVQHLTPIQEEEINKKIGDMISVVLEIKYTCPNCNEEFIIEKNDFLLSN